MNYLSKFEILAVTEARITEHITDHEINIAGFNVIRCHSANRYTGGIVCYIKNNISFDVMYNVDFEVYGQLAQELSCLIVLYGSPSLGIPSYLEQINLLEELITLNIDNLYITGDFNADVSIEKNTCYGKKIIEVMQKFSFEQKVKE